MSQRLPEINALQCSMQECAVRAWRLNERARLARVGPRRDFLKTMASAYMSFGLAQSHEDFGVEAEKVSELRAGAYRKLQSARDLCRI